MPIFDAAGKVTSFVCTSRDITERKNSREQLAHYTAQLREKNTEMEDDLHMAREIQDAFIPQHYPSFPCEAPVEQSALRFYHKYRPTTEVGGDFFHVLRLSDTMAGVFICDVMGHGVRAALITAMQRGRGARTGAVHRADESCAGLYFAAREQLDVRLGVLHGCGCLERRPALRQRGSSQTVARPPGRRVGRDAVTGRKNGAGAWHFREAGLFGGRDAAYAA